MRQNTTITALVISAMKWNWAKHYLRSVGFHDNQIRYILARIRNGRNMITGNVKYVRFILDLA